MRAKGTENPPGLEATDVTRRLSRGGGRKPGAPRAAIAIAAVTTNTTNNTTNNTTTTTTTTNPAVATIQTRTTRHKVATELKPEEVPIPIPEVVAAAVVSPASKENVKENVRPSTPPDDGRRRHAARSKSSRHLRSPSLPKPRLLSPSATTSASASASASVSQSRALAPRPSQKPARTTPATIGSGPPHANGAVPIAPKRTPINKSKPPKPSETPRSNRNIDRIVFGDTCFKAWYPSYYGKEVLGDVSASVGGGGSTRIGGGKREPPMLDRLYICPCCFKYSKEIVPWGKHVQYCEKKAFVPGTKIYTHPRHSKTVSRPRTDSALPSSVGTGAARSKGKNRGDNNDQLTDEAMFSEGEWSVWEVDGEKDGLFCQNLSLFAKLFLDNKSVFFDVSGFNYFLLVYTPPLSGTHPVSPMQTESAPEPLAGSEHSAPIPSHPPVSATSSPPPCSRPQIVGFFSKEKMSWDNNNLACILVFPPWQRKGLGALLMGVSYEISRREGILGGPEKPISELGRKGYKRFWAGEIIRWILDLDPTPSSSESTHTSKSTRREKEKEREQEDLCVDVEQCSRDTWIVPEDCLATLREMGVIEETGLGLPKAERDASRDGSTDPNTQGKEKEEKESKLPPVPRARIDKAAVRAWARENKIELARACDPDGFVEGYAIKQAEDNDEEE